MMIEIPKLKDIPFNDIDELEDDSYRHTAYFDFSSLHKSPVNSEHNLDFKKGESIYISTRDSRFQKILQDTENLNLENESLSNEEKQLIIKSSTIDLYDSDIQKEIKSYLKKHEEINFEIQKRNVEIDSIIPSLENAFDEKKKLYEEISTSLIDMQTEITRLRNDLATLYDIGEIERQKKLIEELYERIG